MSIKRVQKLLFSEYCDFEDMVLIESPFAQTTREGRGLRQVHLGLTPSKLVLATDVLPPVEKSCINFLPGIDPDIETFELIAIYPIDCVNLSVFRRRKRQTIKAHFCNNRVFYFELGGFENRDMFWNLWCEKVKFLSPESGSSHSETSVATSSTNSTLYLVDSKQVVKPNGLTQVWCKFGTGKIQQSVVKVDKSYVIIICTIFQGLVPKWTDRYLYLGKNFEDFSSYKPVINSPRMSQFLKPRKISNFSVSSTKTHQSQLNEIHIGDSYHINRFGLGIREGCRSRLFLPAEDYIVPRRFSQISDQSSVMYDLKASDQVSDTMDMAEECVRLWELYKETDPNKYKSRHRRRYGIAPQPLFLYGLGPWNINPGAKYSIQVKRAVSVVTIRRQPIESELRLPVTKRQLVATISCETLHRDKVKINNQVSCGGSRRPVIFFWTPDYWYRPRSAKDAYQELQNHLAKINLYHQKAKKRKRLFRRWGGHQKPETSDSDTDSTTASKTPRYRKAKKRKSMMRFNVFGGKNHDVCDVDQEKTAKETSLQYLKRLLKIDVLLTAWDFNSTTLAQQLTMIDRDLFLKISGIELSVLISQQSSKNAPNVAAIVAFSHRISCLVASDILKNECERFTDESATYCQIYYCCRKVPPNFQFPVVQDGFIWATKSRHLQVENYMGLCKEKTRQQISVIFFFCFVTSHHKFHFRAFEFLCRLYRDPRLLDYQKTFFFSSRATPYLPFIGDIIAKLLDRIPEYKIGSTAKDTNALVKSEPKTIEGPKKDSNLFKKLLMSMKLVNFQESSVSKIKDSTGRRGLCDYFKPLDCYEDNRIRCLVETTEFLQQCQLSALHYSFMPNSLATDYLLKARYKEERDNFFQSFRVESYDYTKR
ncbi:uncharacterized protein BDFB_006762 [Asbolus verrucosus]|uniref:Ras-GEF domain-containing protein n=1 Tax=Asbolus verrucosus TaxID=1661398 RepID=A0A482WBJ3_ASBVE|nr:uncharacterized protein BDFB_006762 [Asbolus verrucosus]